jgi:ketosteroid isomerase-like protein
MLREREIAMSDTVDELRAVEHERIAAFVARDVEALERLHADDFQLINPGGQELSKRAYIGGIEGGMIEYRLWEVDSPVDVRLYGDAAVIRYRALIEIAVQGDPQPRQSFWHTDVYERRDGRWQAVWSQATRVAS